LEQVQQQRKENEKEERDKDLKLAAIEELETPKENNGASESHGGEKPS